MSNYLEKAITTLRSLGIRLQPQESPVLSILERIAKYDLQRVTAIAATLQQSSAFNAAIRENLEGMDVSSRYANIVDGFNSIVEDARQVAAWMEDGRLDLKERAQLQWMKLRRGSILEVRVNPDDLGKVIGRGGRTATAFRTVISALAGRGGARIDFVDVDRRS